MKLLFYFRLCLFLVSAIGSVHAQGLGDFVWTSTAAFPGVSFSNPVGIASPPGETNRLFVVQQGGSIIVISNLDVPTATTFLNLNPRVTAGIESGLLGMAFHPGYATNRYFYLFYTYKTNIAAQIYWDVLSRFQTSASDPNQADTNSEVRLFTQVDRAENHNGGDLHFGPDGYLYVSVGDEGKEDPYHNGQRIDSNLFSGILRIDVDKRPGSLSPNPSPTFAVTTNYTIPPDNPFVGATNFNGLPVDPGHVRTEFWAVGLRNPWRFSFDSLTGSLYCGDVGQDAYEEIDILARGGNGGWPYYEGNSHGGPDVQGYNPPVISYNHGSAATNGNCVIGGVVYRGTRFPQLYGAYVFGDWTGRWIWGSFCNGTNSTPPVYLTGAQARGFGTDPRNGDVLFVDSANLSRLVSQTPVINSITCLESNIVIGGAGAKSNQFLNIFGSSNLSIPFTNWGASGLARGDALGNFVFTNAINPATPQKFYRLK